MKEERTQWIDWAKTIGMWLVVFGHIPGHPAAVSEFIYAFHMPLFFFLSGYLARTKSVPDAVKSGVVRLLVPYALFYGLTWVWWFVFGYLRHPEWFPHLSMVEAALARPLFGMLLGVGHDTPGSHMVNVPLWFLVGLFQLGVVVALVESLQLTRPAQYLTVALLAAVPYLLQQQGVDLLFSLDSALMALPFYVVGKEIAGAGAGLAPRLARWRAMAQGHLAVLVIVVLLALLGLVATTNGRVDINLVRHGHHPLLFYLGGLLGIALVCAVSAWCARQVYGPTIVTISRGAIVLLALHSIVTGLFLGLLRALEVAPDLLWSAAISTAVLLLCVPLIELVESAAPVLVGRRVVSSAEPEGPQPGLPPLGGGESSRQSDPA